MLISYYNLRATNKFLNIFYEILSLFVCLFFKYSMLPLFYKDGLTFAYVCTTCVFALVVFFYYYLNEHQRQNGFWPKLNLGSVRFINYTFNVGFKIGVSIQYEFSNISINWVQLFLAQCTASTY